MTALPLGPVVGFALAGFTLKLPENLKGETVFSCFLFKRVVARRAVYHTLNVITISLYVCPPVCVKWV